MYTPLLPPALEVTADDPRSVDADWLIVPVFEDEHPPLPVTDFGGELQGAFAAARAAGKRFDFSYLAGGGSKWRARGLVLLGAGAAEEYSPEIARRLASAAVIQARDRRVAVLAFLHRHARGRGDEIPLEVWVRAEAEGLTLGAFSTARYKTAEADHRESPVARLVVPGDGGGVPAEWREAAARGTQLAHCANLARELVNEPGNLLSPSVLADRARELAAGTGLAIEVLGARQLAELGMGLLLGVGQGSHQPPQLIVLTHNPPGAPDDPVLALVGKGVTFDSGGISIKAADGMERMKDDMAGGAAVLLAMRAISLLQTPIRVVGIVPAVENMPGGSAIRPGDVLTAVNGRTVEVINTDAEGRLILGDAVAYARRLGATHVVDIATLTGACMVALGKSTSGLFGRPDAWRDEVRDAAERCGERAWPMPVFDDYRELLKSEIADTANTGGRYAGAITAAIFIGEFAAGIPWAHLDVAGTAWNDEAKPYLPKGPTGVGVRTLADLASAMAGGVRATRPSAGGNAR